MLLLLYIVGVNAGTSADERLYRSLQAFSYKPLTLVLQASIINGGSFLQLLDYLTARGKTECLFLTFASLILSLILHANNSLY